MNEIKLLIPIREKISTWIAYERERPKCEYKGNQKMHDDFRATHDLDCILTNGNLNADTIISLTFPLRQTLNSIWGENIDIPPKNDNARYWIFMEDLYNNTEYYLPPDNYLVGKLSVLFEMGMGRENVMLLPQRWLQRRGGKLYYDYMPYFLIECFEGGYFHEAFGNDKSVVEWIKKEHLEMFFENKVINKRSIKDLHGTQNVRKNLPLADINHMLDNYIGILKERAHFFEN